MRKLDAFNFYLHCNDCKQTQWMPASVHATVSGSQHSAWVTHVLIGFRFYKHKNTGGNLWNLEVFYKKTSPVTPLFIPLILILSEVIGNAREKMKKFWGRKFLLNRAFSLTWPASVQIHWNKRKRLHKKRVKLPQDCLGTPAWPPFHCFGTPIWPPWRHVKTLYKNVLFSTFAKNPLHRIFLKSMCIFLF